MKKINIIKNGQLAYSSGNMSEADANAWVANCLEKNKFGAPAVYESVFNEQTGQFEQVLVSPAEEFEIVELDLTAELAAASLKADKIEKGRKARQACESVLDLIGGFNIDRALTFEQKNDMKMLFANAKGALNDFQPSYAKYFISNIEADGTLVTQEMKDLCLELLNEY